MSKTSASASHGLSAPEQTPEIEWQWSRFAELSVDDLYAVVRLRETVFVVEQNCAYLDAEEPPMRG